MAELLGGRYVAQGASRPTAYGTAVRAGRAGTGTPVTVELLDPRLLADPAARARLAEGADRLRAASGRHLVQVLEVWAPDGAVVHDRFPGVSVAGLRSQAGGVLPADRAGALVADVLDGLAALHAAGLVHGALTEHDVLLDDATPLRSEVRLTGYGLAALLGPPYGLPDVPGGSGTPAADVW
ncbi:MAG: hypothetical protein JWN57_372, partial [Frankiales bacterium]|nr:hypothetical protein [Frankiales bacterium]